MTANYFPIQESFHLLHEHSMKPVEQHKRMKDEENGKQIGKIRRKGKINGREHLMGGGNKKTKRQVLPLRVCAH